MHRRLIVVLQDTTRYTAHNSSHSKSPITLSSPPSKAHTNLICSKSSHYTKPTGTFHPPHPPKKDPPPSPQGIRAITNHHKNPTATLTQHPNPKQTIPTNNSRTRSKVSKKHGRSPEKDTPKRPSSRAQCYANAMLDPGKDR